MRVRGLPIMQPIKNMDWANPTLYLSPQIKLHSATVELRRPSTHSHDPGFIPQTLVAAALQSVGSMHCHRGWWSAKMTIMVCRASKVQPKLASTKFFHCHGPNSPQYFPSMSSIVSLSVAADSTMGSIVGNGRWYCSWSSTWLDVDVNVIVLCGLESYKILRRETFCNIQTKINLHHKYILL